MKETLELLNKIRNALGGDKCEVMVLANDVGGISIRVHWRDGSNFALERKFNHLEVEDTVNDSVWVDNFIEWAKHQKELHSKLASEKDHE